MTDRPHVELYLRSLAPSTGRETQEEVVARLDALDEADHIKGYEVLLCGDCVCPQSVTAQTDPGSLLLDQYERFESWADRAGRDLAAFETKDIQSVVTGTSVTGVVFPRMVLAEYRSGSLDFVAPSTNGTATVDVLDRLDEYSE